MQTRKRLVNATSKGLSTGERINREKLSSSRDIYERWSWVGVDVKDASQIAQEHCLLVSGLGGRSSKAPCRNKYATESNDRAVDTPVRNEDDDDSIIVVSDNDEPPCEKKLCRERPFCLNYLGQEVWVDEENAGQSFHKAHLRRKDPRSQRRILPVGLKNLGATCYANAFLQVWFRDLAFRTAVYRCQPSHDSLGNFEASPIFQLQVTFAALEASNLSVFNPVKLVESLKLRTSEQQDAQEFSKLFMSHLDSEFKKQDDPMLQSLLPDQFEGTLAYVTVCENCKARSEREAGFLELEVNLVKGESLEQRLHALVAPERLTDDNKYLCSRCESLQTATRFTELRRLPPVLHISLLRFVYDLSSGERRKSKLPLKFPPYLRMNEFMQEHSGSSADDSMDVDVPAGGAAEQIYELRGVLLHRGISAYHGHYVAHVYDSTAGRWYQFNDEVVSALDSFHDPQKTEGSGKAGTGKTSAATKQPKRQKTAPKRRVDDSDDESRETMSPPNDTSPNKVKYLTSSDAYMLIYARAEPQSQSEGSGDGGVAVASTSSPSEPPSRAMEIVREQNEFHERECAEYMQEEKKVDEDFRETRRMLFDIFQSWSIEQLNERYVVASRKGLEDCLAQFFNADSPSDVNAGKAEAEDDHSHRDSPGPSDKQSAAFNGGSAHDAEVSTTASWKYTIDNSDILCRHGALDPLRPSRFKGVSARGRDKLAKSGCKFSPELTSRDLCRICVVDEFKEALYMEEHPHLVAEINALYQSESDDCGYWISKPWFRDWSLMKPKMHVQYSSDPPPDSTDFLAHVKCEHGNLTLNSSNRRRITAEAVAILRRLFPYWNPLPWDAEECPVCDAQVHQSKESKLEQRKMAEVEKMQLRRLYEEDVFGPMSLPGTSAGALVKSSFVKAWRSWLLRPGYSTRPGALDNSDLLCEHEKIMLDLQDPLDFDDDLVVVTMPEWETLEQLYSAKPLLAVQMVEEITEDGSLREEICTELFTCEDCRARRRLDFASTPLTIISLGQNDPVPDANQTRVFLRNESGHQSMRKNEKGKAGKTNGTQTTLTSYGGSRQSKRIRERKSRRERIVVSKDTTVLDIKVKIQSSTGLEPFSQHLYYRGSELADNKKTVAELQIFVKDVIFLKEDTLDGDGFSIDSDSDDGRRTRRRDEGNAFDGTLLGSLHRQSSAGVTSSGDEHEEADAPVRPCPQCTFHNPIDSVSCSICFAIF